MREFLILDLQAPTMSFGKESVDALNRVGDFPSISMVTGLLANALGYDRSETSKHAALQDELEIASVIIDSGKRVTDFQTAELAGNDRGWTTRGYLDERAGGGKTYESPHIRYRELDFDKRVLCVVGVRSGSDLAVAGLVHAITYPARPLFVGRKPNLPSNLIGWLGAVQANLIDEALVAALTKARCNGTFRASLPGHVAPQPRDQIEYVSDRRDWVAGFHSGRNPVRLRTIESSQEIAA